MNRRTIYAECIDRIDFIVDHPEAYGGAEKALARIAEILDQSALRDASGDKADKDPNYQNQEDES